MALDQPRTALGGVIYRVVMRIAHRFNWHYARKHGPLYPDGDYQLWCHWCGFRMTLPKEHKHLNQ